VRSVVTTIDAAELDPAGWSGEIVLAAFREGDGAVAGHGGELLRTALGVDIDTILRTADDFVGGAGQLLRCVVSDSGRFTLGLTVAGLGARSRVTVDSLRDAALVTARASSAASVTSLLALELGGSAEAVDSVVEGVRLGDYRYPASGRSEPDDVRELRLVLPAGTRFAAAVVDHAMASADAVNWVRRLVETPANLLGPKEFADAILERARDLAPDSLEARVWSREELEANGFGATLAVGAGSARSPLVVELTSSGAGETIALAGKGITFDAGGINLKKDSGELAWMKSDMAGAASVAAAVIAVAALGTGIRMHAILPIAENLPAGTALKPGDVVAHPGGRTTEVTDTDSEGRLVLADAIAYLATTSPNCIVDVGTLTDSGAVGTAFWGCWTSEPVLAASLIEAGAASGDPGWRLPLHESYRSLLESSVADSVNAPLDAPDTGQIAATYLAPFAGEVPWAHIDNGSGAYLERDAGPWRKGATGTPTRALIRFLRASTGA